jgi:hypothetical protein
MLPSLHYLALPALVISSQLIVLTALITPSTPIRRASFFTIICLINIYIIEFTTSVNALSNYSIGAALVGRVVAAFDFIVLTDVQEDLRPLGQRIPASRFGFADRTKWGLELICNPRGIGWNFQIPRIKPSKDRTYSRWRFVLGRLIRTLKSYLLLDTMYSLSRLASSKLGRRMVGSWLSPSVAMVTSVAAWLTFPYAGMEMSHSLAAAGAVAIGLSTPGDWPEMYGSFRDAYTVGRFWSYVEHLS